MSLTLFKDTPTQALRKIEADIRMMRPDISFNRYYGMTPRKIDEKIERLRLKNQHLTETMANRTWLLDPNYLYRMMMIEGLEIVRNLREQDESSEVLQPGMTYYSGVMQFGDRLSGNRCMVREGHEPGWVKFSEHVAVQKALEVLRYGDENDFRVIYMEHADGRPDSLNRISLSHLKESSPEALMKIEAYCDSRWDGPWPWESRNSLKLQSKIEEAKAMRMKPITEMQAKMQKLIGALYESEMDKYEVISAVQTMIDQVDSMIKDLGKLSSSAIEASASARAFVGDDVGGQIEQAITPVIQNSSQTLSNLKSQLEQAKNKVETGGDSGMGGGMAPPMGDDSMGSPGQAMGEDPLAGDMADVDLNGSSDERDMKTA